MRVMILVKADANSEAGAMPTHELLADMMNYNEELVKAGVSKLGIQSAVRIASVMNAAAQSLI